MPEGQVICGIGVNNFAEADNIPQITLKLCTVDSHVKQDRSAEIPTFVSRKLSFASEASYPF